MGMCKFSGGIVSVFADEVVDRKIEDRAGWVVKISDSGTRIDNEENLPPDSRIDLWPDRETYVWQQDNWLQIYRGEVEDRRITSRWTDSDSRGIHDRDYTDHGFAQEHPDVPHDHPIRWRRGQKQRQRLPQKPDPKFC